MSSWKRCLILVLSFSVGFLLMWNWRDWNWHPHATAIIFGIWLAALTDLLLKPKNKTNQTVQRFGKGLLFVTMFGYLLFAYSIIRISDCSIAGAGLVCMTS